VKLESLDWRIESGLKSFEEEWCGWYIIAASSSESIISAEHLEKFESLIELFKIGSSSYFYSCWGISYVKFCGSVSVFILIAFDCR